MLIMTTTTVSAIPKREKVEAYDKWVVSYVPEQHEYWAYTRLDNDYLFMLVASKDVVGPGCYVTNYAISSDTQTFRRYSDRLTALIKLGSHNYSSTLLSEMIKSKRDYSSAYGVLTTPPKDIEELIRTAYNKKTETLNIILRDNHETVVNVSGSTVGMYSAYNRMLDLCKLTKRKHASNFVLR